LAVYAFAFQIYCDFAGYSNIARGLGKCMGFDIMINFNLPYFTTNPQDFWNRWHISLSNWLRDYLYIPIAFKLRRWGVWSVVFTLMSTFLICGLWHGAKWTFVIWGTYYGVLLVIHKLLTPVYKKLSLPKIPFLQEIWFYMKAAFFFHLVCFGWLMFRANSLTQLCNMLHSLFFDFNIVHSGVKVIGCSIVFYTWLLLLIEVIQHRKNDLMIISKLATGWRYAFYYACFLSIMLFGYYGAKAFIYFKF
jgi:alginate O-acetyltransferase complex protein AlgI